MSLAVGIIAKDGIVIASDSRMSSVQFSNDEADKILVLSDELAVGIAGDGALAFHIFDLIKQNPGLTWKDGIHQSVESLHEIFSKAFDKYYSGLLPKEREPLELLVCGYALNKERTSHLYILSSEDNFVPRQSPAGHECIGRTEISTYILNRINEKGKMALKEAKELAVFCIRETQDQTKSVGGLTKVGAICNGGKFELLSKPEVAKIVKQCNKRQGSLKNKFYPEDTDGSDLL